MDNLLDENMLLYHTAAFKKYSTTFVTDLLLGDEMQSILQVEEMNCGGKE